MFSKIKPTKNIFLYSYTIVLLSFNMSSRAELWESVSTFKNGSEIVVTEVDKASITSSGEYRFAIYRILPLEEKQRSIDKSESQRWVDYACSAQKLYRLP